jgi:3-oxoacyl-[acyl-carrier protein] reductase
VRLKNKVAIVTGASRGIGKAIALALAREGAHVTVAARTATESQLISGTIKETAEEIQAMGVRALTIKTDVSNEQQVKVMVQKTLEVFKRVDILVNNAAVNRPALFKDISQSLWDAIVRITLNGTVLCTRAVLPVMMQQMHGHIINLSSVAAQMVRHEPFTGLAYDMSKAAINRFTWGLAQEVKAYNIAVSALAPSNTKTEGWSYLNPDVDTAQWQRPEIWGSYTAFVATQDPKQCTGRTLTESELQEECANAGWEVP